MHQPVAHAKADNKNKIVAVSYTTASKALAVDLCYRNYGSGDGSVTPALPNVRDH